MIFCPVLWWKTGQKFTGTDIMDLKSFWRLCGGVCWFIYLCLSKRIREHSHMTSDNLQVLLTYTYLAYTQFGPETSLAPHSLMPRAYFGPKHTSAWRILRPREYFGPVPTSARKHFGSKQLWTNRLQLRDQSFKNVIFHQFWPSIGSGSASGRN